MQQLVPVIERALDTEHTQTQRTAAAVVALSLDPYMTIPQPEGRHSAAAVSSEDTPAEIADTICSAPLVRHSGTRA